MNLIYTGRFMNYYEYPLNEEAQMCEQGKEMFVDRHLTRQGSPPRLATVVEIKDDTDGRRVQFVEVHHG